MPQWSEHCPAKLNLYLAVTGRRADGYHDLVSLVAPLVLGDTLEAAPSLTGADTLTCDDSELSCGPDNLVLKATAAFRNHIPNAPFLAWKLTKKVPYGAGMGGGSSDAASALVILNKACGNAMKYDDLSAIAAGIGSDCPMFLHNGPCIMRGRGEKIFDISADARKSLQGRGVVVIKPHFSIPTAWAYGAMDKDNAFTPSRAAEAELARWISNPCSSVPVRNSFMDLVYAKYVAYNALNETLSNQGLPKLILTGSGSACYAFAEEECAQKIIETSVKSLGEDVFAVFTRIRV